jgi:hypothetical protein
MILRKFSANGLAINLRARIVKRRITMYYFENMHKLIDPVSIL